MLLENKTTWDQWFYVTALMQLYLMIVAVLVCYGDHGDEKNFVIQFFRRISNCLERWTGYPGWAAAGALTGLAFLGEAAIGVYWDVAFHVDFGRDKALFTPSHTMIVVGLAGLTFAALIATIFATVDKADVGFRVGGLRVPWSAALIGMFGIGGVAAFPLDNMWHEAYGVDVTLWSPTHLQLVAGGSFATIACWLMLREDRWRRTLGQPVEPTLLGRGILATILGAVLVGCSLFQGEFDFGVPQFQVLYLPVLIAVAAGFSLVLGRLALGEWGALKTVLAFLIIRGVIGLLVAGPFNSTFPVFPLYLVSAAAVDGIGYFLGTENRLRFALTSGAVIGTVGLLADLTWLSFLHDVDPSPSGLPKAILVSLLGALGAAVLGAAMGRPAPGPRRKIPAAAVVAGGLLVIGVVAYPLPRNVGDVQAAVHLIPEGDKATVEVQLTPPDAAENATAFGVVAWQGGGQVSASLKKIGDGKYVSDKALPVTGRWKTMVGLQRGDEVMALPIYFPADPEINAPEIPAVDRTDKFARNTVWLLRESHRGDSGVANAAYTGVAIVSLIWIGLFALCAMKFEGGEDDEAGSSPPPSPRQRPAFVGAHRAGGAGGNGANGWNGSGRADGAGGNGHGADDERYSLQNRSIVPAAWGTSWPGESQPGAGGSSPD